jgi:predicted lysophospholipase L1 biosynthesis ABC-type transport system permease subunit
MFEEARFVRENGSQNWLPFLICTHIGVARWSVTAVFRLRDVIPKAVSEQAQSSACE